MNNFNYTKLTPFKWFVLENFPFIEADFDALTEWQLFCKLGKEINKIITSTNTLGTQVETLTDYVSNYFDNLDVQEEINNKLNEMAESGQLTEIIAQYLQLAGLLCFNTVNDMKNAQNLANGSFAKTYGTNAYNDGLGNFYKIREILNTDVVDNINIIALTNYNNLIAELIPNAYINDILQQIQDIRDYGITLMMGDSYGVGIGSVTDEIGWCEHLKDYLGLNNNNYIKFAYGGCGFIGQVTSITVKQLLQNNISQIENPLKVKRVIMGFGANDWSFNKADLENAVAEFFTYAKSVLPNAKFYLFETGFSSFKTANNTNSIIGISKVYNAYKKCIDYGVTLNSSSCQCLRFDENMNMNINHPNDKGYKEIAKAMFNILNFGDNFNNNNIDIYNNQETINPITIYQNQPVTNVNGAYIKLTYVSNMCDIEIAEPNNQGYISLTLNNHTMGHLDIPIGTIPMNNFHGAKLYYYIPVIVQFGFSDYTGESDVGRLRIDIEGNITLQVGRPHGVSGHEITAINLYQLNDVILPIGII